MENLTSLESRYKDLERQLESVKDESVMLAMLEIMSDLNRKIFEAMQEDTQTVYNPMYD